MSTEILPDDRALRRPPNRALAQMANTIWTSWCWAGRQCRYVTGARRNWWHPAFGPVCAMLRSVRSTSTWDEGIPGDRAATSGLAWNP